MKLLKIRTLHGLLILLSAAIGGYSVKVAFADRPSVDETGAIGIPIPTGQLITPTAAKGAIFQDFNPGHPQAPDLRAGQAVSVAVSPDGRTLAVQTSGFNVYFDRDGQAIPELSTEYLFLFDITGPSPRQIQVIPMRNAFDGLLWARSSDRLYASGGSDDIVREFVRNGAKFDDGRTIPLGHTTCVGLDRNPGYYGDKKRKCGAVTAGIALSPDGAGLLTANIQNDSVSLIDLSLGRVVAERDLRPGIIDPKRSGQAGGSFPRAVAWISPNRAYVASERDREIISLAITRNQTGARISVVRRMPVHGQPLALLTNRSGSRLYVALDNTNEVAIFDTSKDTLIESLDATAPPSIYANVKHLGGANTNALALTPDQRTLLVSNGGQNSLAVVQLSDRARGVPVNRKKDPDGDADRQSALEHSAVIGLVPTGRYPTGVATSKDGSTWYVVNFKHEPGPSAHWCGDQNPPATACIPENWGGRRSKEGAAVNFTGLNVYPWRLEKAGLLTLPAPSPLELARLTKQVARNNRFDKPETAAADEKMFSFLRQHIKHVIYIVKENKTYDEVLGDLEVGNGDPRLTFFPRRFTPNHHAISRNFVTLDNFLVAGAGSWTGWDWSASAQNNDFRVRTEALASASAIGGRAENGIEGEPGVNRNINMAYATSAERRAIDPVSPSDPNILPGARDVAAPDGPGGAEGEGYLWSAAARSGRTVRNWGFYGGFFLRQTDQSLVRDPHAQNLRVFFPTAPSLMQYSDPYYYSFDPAMPDYWRFQEWKREFAEFSEKKSAPNLMLVQLANDHGGHFASAIDGVNTVDTQVADNDYALGLIVETVANSPFANDTVIFSIEDDPLGGFDHVDAFRSVGLVAGAYVRQHAVVSTRYTTVSVIKTIEELLGIEPMGLNDALAAPMTDLFDPNVTSWSYKPIVPDVLRSTKLPLPPAGHPVTAANRQPRRSAAYWIKALAGQDFSEPDRIDPVAFNRALWQGFKGDAPYPATK
jgi:DNA-binding beta-propeller fold protein YncE